MFQLLQRKKYVPFLFIDSRRYSQSNNSSGILNVVGMRFSDKYILKQRIIINDHFRQFSATLMKSQNKIEVQAIMNLLYLGDFQEPLANQNNFTNKQINALHDYELKSKSNTLHLKATKNVFSNKNTKHQSLQQSLYCIKHSTQNKENLKRILKKLENSPSPPRKHKQQNRHIQNERVRTQILEPQTKSKECSLISKSLQIAKKSLDKLYCKRKEKEFIKTLIKAKIVEKLKKNETKRLDKKVYCLDSKITTLRDFDGKIFHQQPRMSAKTWEKSQSKSNFLNLLWEEKRMNNPLSVESTSKVRLKQLLF